MTHATYHSHPLRAQLAQILDMQGRDEFADPAVAENEPIAFARDKVFGVARLIATLLEVVPATLASSTALASMHAQLGQPLNELSNFLSNRNPGHIANAATQLEQNVMPHLWGLPQQIREIGGDSLSAIVARQAQSSLETIKFLNAQRGELESQFNAVHAQADALAAQLQAQAEAAARERAESAAMVANLQITFAEKEIERATAFEAASEKRRIETTATAEILATEVKKQITDHTVSLDALVKTLQEKADGLVGAIETKRQEASRIVQVVGNIGVTGNYQQIANAEAAQANFWRWATVAFFGAGISLAGLTFYKFWLEPLSPENLWSVSIRLLYAIAITAPAWYTARESARHRSNSDRARQTELELASIGPFIELMPEDKKVQIRESLTASYFGRKVDPHEVNSPLDLGNLKDLVIELVKAVRK